MHPIGKRAFAAIALVATTAIATRTARAYITELPASLAHDVLSETVPTAFAGFELSTADYEIEWAGRAPEGVAVELIPDTIQWVRVADVLALPRARVQVRASGAEAGRVSNAGFSQALTPWQGGGGAQGELRAELPVALISGDRNPVEITIARGGREQSARASLKFKPRAALGEERVFYDASCSRFGVRAEGSAQSSKARGWAYVGCRVAEVEGAEHRTSSLEAWVFWDGVGQELLVGGARTPSSSVSVWPLRLRSEPGRVQLAVPGGGEEMVLHYSAPDNFHRGALGMGIGPYWDHFAGNGEESRTPAPVLTLYGSYFITEALRVVAFDATTLDSHLTTDFGIYLNPEYLRFFDRRIVINLLLGVHAIGFASQGQYLLRIGVPQGVEVQYVDFLSKARNLTAGFFLYPLIDGISYYNLWLRWGGRVFGEFNYISWDNKIGDVGIHSESAGISVGFPIGRFL